MISQELLDMLRCPLDPSQKLAETPEGLVCQRCRLRFPVREGIPCMVVEDAELPPGCERMQELPCQQTQASGGNPETTASPANQ